MTYIANHMIRYEDKLFKKGEELKGLPRDVMEDLIRHKAVTQYGGKAEAPKPAEQPKPPEAPKPATAETPAPKK